LTKDSGWLADLANKAKIEADLANQEVPHPILELRRDNMVGLESRLNAVIRRELGKDRRDAR